MTKQDILEKLYERKGAEQDSVLKEKIDSICNIFRLIREEERIEKTIPEIEEFVNCSTSIDYNTIEAILDKLKDWIKSHTHTVEGYVLDSMNKKSKVILNVFLGFIAILALAAVPFALLNFFMGENFCGGRGDDIANILGTLDFALGAWGFIWERKDDMKKKEIRNASKRVNETGDTEQFINIVTSQHNVFGKNVIDYSKHYHY